MLSSCSRHDMHLLKAVMSRALISRQVSWNESADKLVSRWVTTAKELSRVRYESFCRSVQKSSDANAFIKTFPDQFSVYLDTSEHFRIPGCYSNHIQLHSDRLHHNDHSSCRQLVAVRCILHSSCCFGSCSSYFLKQYNKIILNSYKVNCDVNRHRL